MKHSLRQFQVIDCLIKKDSYTILEIYHSDYIQKIMKMYGSTEIIL